MSVTTALTNAFGVSVGACLFLGLVECQGQAYVLGMFPDLQGGNSWPRTTAMVTDMGLAGATVVAAMPIVIHPLLVLGLVAGMKKIELVTAVFLGRSIKYMIMSSCAVYSPRLLSYIGVSESTLRSATEAVRGKLTVETQPEGSCQERKAKEKG